MSTFPNGALASEWPLLIQQGSDLKSGVQFNYQDEAVDLTGCTFAGKIRDKFGASSTVLQTLSFNTSALASGYIEITLTAAQTAAMTVPVGTNDDQREAVIGVYDVELTQGGVVTRVLYGQVTLSREATY
jgi:hypothetical protein